MFIAIEILGSFARLVNTGKIVEVKSAGLQLVKTHLVLSRWIHAHQDASVLAQDAVDTPDVTGVVTIQTVIEGDAAYV